MNKLRVFALFAVFSLGSVPAFAQRGAPPPVPPPMQEVANRLVEAINSQNAADLTAMTAADAIYLDEDGHALPAAAWIGRITANPKNMEISGMRGQVWTGGGWVSFNYTLDETLQDRPVTLRGTASVVLEQTGGDWTIRMVHGALEQTVSGLLTD